MPTVLVLNSSAAGEASVSRKLVQEAVARLRDQNAALEVVERDLGSEPIPHLTVDAALALRNGKAANQPQAATLSLSDALIEELKGADVVVIGAPMYNFGIPSTLKSWFDHVLRAGITFRYSESGPEGLVTGKRAIVIESRGGHYSEGPAKAMDSQEPHLRTLLGFIGITDVAFVRAEKLAFGPEARDLVIGAAQAELGRLTQDALPRAA